MINKFLDKESVYVLVPLTAVTQRMLNLSTSNEIAQLIKVPDREFYLIETVAPINDVFLDYPLLNSNEARSLFTPEIEEEENSLWESVLRFLGL